MDFVITYIHHNCFVLTAGARTFLFDYPASQHLSDHAVELVRAAVKDADLYVFASHSHEDHFTPAILRLADTARRTRFVLSYDIVELFAEFDPEHLDNVIVVEPEERYRLDGMDIEAFESTDLGVGFLITLEGARIYFGGDVAEWVWENQEAPAKAFSRRHFGEILDKLKARQPIHVAFSNADHRLANWAGGTRFVHEIQPTLFVPMHTFGNVEWLPRFATDLGPTATQLFLYAKTGERVALSV